MTTRIQPSQKHPGTFDVVAVMSIEFELVIMHHVSLVTAQRVTQLLVERRKSPRA